MWWEGPLRAWSRVLTNVLGGTLHKTLSKCLDQSGGARPSDFLPRTPPLRHCSSRCSQIRFNSRIEEPGDETVLLLGRKGKGCEPRNSGTIEQGIRACTSRDLASYMPSRRCCNIDSPFSTP